jgi:hypothetical protein
MDLLGLWVTGAEVFAYSVNAVVRWTPGRSVWQGVPLDPVLRAGPILKVAPLDDGAFAVANDRAIMGFAQLGGPPVFVRDMNTYPYPPQLFGVGDRWWVALSSGEKQRLVQVAADGTVTEVTALPANVQDVIVASDRVVVVCSSEGGDVHKSAIYTMDRSGKGPLRGPHLLPLDTTKTALWGGSIVSGGPLRKVSRVPIPR